jgi:hypothetical protein
MQWLFVSRTIQPTDILLVRHTGFRDVSNIRESLVKEGFEDVLPPNDNVSRLPYVFRHNLAGVSVALESLFPLILPQHPLRHFSHDAWYDSMKTIVMANEAERFCRKERNKASSWNFRRICLLINRVDKAIGAIIGFR